MSSSALAGKTVVIIGGSSGIGLAVAQAVLREGGRPVVASSSAERVAAVVQGLGAGARGLTVNVRDEADLGRAFGEVGAFDHLVYTAGDWSRAGGGPLKDLDLTSAAEAFAVRFWGALAAVKQALPHLGPEGSITLTDGLRAHRPTPGAAVSTAMLGGIEHLGRALAVDLAPRRVNVVCPGLILTERNRRLPETVVKAFADATPLGRAGEPDEVAEAYLYLMRATYVTGQVLMVEGGRLLT